MKKLIPLFAILLIVSCNNPNNTSLKYNAVSIDSIKYNKIADTLVCDVVIKNPDIEDKWTEQCLKNFKREAFIDTLFDDIYSGKIEAYDYYSNEKLEIRKIKEIEKQEGFSRNIIGKMQFNESWMYDRQSHSMIKKVNSVIFGFETFNEEGAVRGYKPLFKVLFN